MNSGPSAVWGLEIVGECDEFGAVGGPVLEIVGGCDEFGRGPGQAGAGWGWPGARGE